MKDELENILSEFDGNSNDLIPALQKVQEHYGYLPENAMLRVADYLNVPESNVFGVASFYSQFRLSPVGKHIISVCHGTACHVLDAPKITETIEKYLNIKDGETSEDMMFTLESVACVGCCSLAPVIMIGEQIYGKVDCKKTLKILKDIKNK